MHAQLGQILDPNDTKRPKNPSVTFKDRMANPNPAHTTTQATTPLAHPLDTPLSSPHVRNSSPHSFQGASKDTCYLFLFPLCCNRAPSKAWLEFLVCSCLVSDQFLLIWEGQEP